MTVCQRYRSLSLLLLPLVWGSMTSASRAQGAPIESSSTKTFHGASPRSNGSGPSESVLHSFDIMGLHPMPVPDGGFPSMTHLIVDLDPDGSVGGKRYEGIPGRPQSGPIHQAICDTSNNTMPVEWRNIINADRASLIAEPAYGFRNFQVTLCDNSSNQTVMSTPPIIAIDAVDIQGFLDEAGVTDPKNQIDALRFVLGHEFAHIRLNDYAAQDHEVNALLSSPSEGRIYAFTRKRPAQIQVFAPNGQSESLQPATVPAVTPADDEGSCQIEITSDLLGARWVFKRIGQDMDDGVRPVSELPEVLHNLISFARATASDPGTPTDHPQKDERQLAIREGYYALRLSQAERADLNSTSSEQQNSGIATDSSNFPAQPLDFWKNVCDIEPTGDEILWCLRQGQIILGYPHCLVSNIQINGVDGNRDLDTIAPRLAGPLSKITSHGQLIETIPIKYDIRCRNRTSNNVVVNCTVDAVTYNGRQAADDPLGRDRFHVTLSPKQSMIVHRKMDLVVTDEASVANAPLSIRPALLPRYSAVSLDKDKKIRGAKYVDVYDVENKRYVRMFSMRQVLSSDNYSVLWLNNKKEAECGSLSNNGGKTVTIHPFDSRIADPFQRRLTFSPPVLLIENRLYVPWRTLVTLTNSRFRPDSMSVKN